MSPGIEIPAIHTHDYTRSEQDNYENYTRVTIDVSEAGILLVTAEATLREVLDSLVDKALVEVVDLRPDAGPAGEDKQLEKQSFRISGSVDGVLRRVMDKYHHSYAIGHLSSAGSQAQSSVTKLFLYGVSQDEGMIVADEQDPTPADAESIPVTGHADPEGSDGVDVRRSTKEKVNVSELLRNRALSAAGNNSAQQHSLSDRSSSGISEPVSGSFDDGNVSSHLADMTRRASEEVQALAEALKAAEKSLEAQLNNQYGESGW